MPLYGGATRALACSGVNISLQLGGYYTGDVSLVAPAVAGTVTHYLPDLSGYLVATNNETVPNQGTLSGKIYNQQIQNLTISNNKLQNSTISGVSLGSNIANLIVNSTLLIVNSSYNSTGMWNGSSEQIVILPEIGAESSASNSDITVDEYGRITSMANGTPPDPPSFSGTTLYSLSAENKGNYPNITELFLDGVAELQTYFDGSTQRTVTISPRTILAENSVFGTYPYGQYGAVDANGQNILNGFPSIEIQMDWPAILEGYNKWHGNGTGVISPFSVSGTGYWQTYYPGYAWMLTAGGDGIACGPVMASGAMECESIHVANDQAFKPDTDTWTIASDSRIKTVLHPYVKGLSAIKQLNPVVYRLNGKFGLKDDEKDHVSVIAQEILSSWPEMVGTYTYKEKSENGEEVETQIYNINASDLMWALVNAFKELSLELEMLENRMLILETQ